MSFYLKTRAIDSGAATIGILRSFRLFKEVLWVSVGQLAAKLQPVKVGGSSYHRGLEPRLPAFWLDSGQAAELFSNLRL